MSRFKVEGMNHPSVGGCSDEEFRRLEPPVPKRNLYDIYSHIDEHCNRERTQHCNL
jgi:hypothetical protein